MVNHQGGASLALVVLVFRHIRQCWSRIHILGKGLTCFDLGRLGVRVLHSTRILKVVQHVIAKLRNHNRTHNWDNIYFLLNRYVTVLLLITLEVIRNANIEKAVVGHGGVSSRKGVVLDGGSDDRAVQSVGVR